MKIISVETVGEREVVDLEVVDSLYESKDGILNHNCDVCKSLWLLEDGITPRLYYMSEMRHGYMDDRHNPFATSGPSHPHCRCTMTMLLKGYGFDAAGLVTWVGMDHDEMKKQRG